MVIPINQLTAGYWLVLVALVLVSADIFALVAALFVSPAVPDAGSVVVAPPVPPLHPTNSRANATAATSIKCFRFALWLPLTFIRLSFRFLSYLKETARAVPFLQWGAQHGECRRSHGEIVLVTQLVRSRPWCFLVWMDKKSATAI